MDVLGKLGLTNGHGLSCELDQHGWFTLRGPVSSLAVRDDKRVPPGGIVQLREQMGHSRYVAARTLGVTSSQLARMESGDGALRWNLLRRAAEYYGVSVGALCEWIVEQVEK